ncbi:MAG TPA: hypothetical protein VHR18_00140 [Solirubrobacterales bacterium]|jgi:hypothetical protein|nr:hypothetical protein [Solirubrobacterales bacterium]
MSRRLRWIPALALVLCLLLVGGAHAISFEFLNTVVSSTATMLPRELPASGGAPVTISSITRIKSKDGSPPATLGNLKFMIDEHGYIEAKGVPVCTVAKLEGTTVSEARQRCGNALVGKGLVKAMVSLPGQASQNVSLPVSIFNGPKVKGQPSMVAHAYETVPAKKTLLVPITIEKINKGRYGFGVDVEIPEIAGGYGAPTLAEASVGRTFTRGGKKVGYVNAYCAGGRLQVQGKLTFTNGDFFPATLTSPCHVPR